MLSITLLSLLGGAAAFPQVLDVLQGREVNFNLNARDVAQPGCTTSAACENGATYPVSDEDAGTTTRGQIKSDNCGSVGVCDTFNAAEQFVSTTGDHAFQAPGKTDIRGPCPGLNAAANHGYLPRNGIATIDTTTNGLFDAFGLAKDFNAILAVFSIINAGSLETMTWSIGGPQPNPLLGPVLGQAQGISYTHNFYEGDTSITRCDAYTNGGDAHSSSLNRFRNAWESKDDNGHYTMDTMGVLYTKNAIRSVMTNPYYFAAPVSTTVVAPAAYNFVIALMSNHSAEYPGGYLNSDMLQTFFAWEGEYPNFTWNKGHERIPDNWYRRPNQNPYFATSLAADVVVENLAYPKSFRLGGNTNGVNTYTGVDLTDLTGGVYNADTLLEGNNLGCFFFQSLQQAVPTQLQGAVDQIAKANALITQYMPADVAGLNCPQLGKYDSSVFQPYTGKGSPTAPPSNGGVTYC